MLKDAQLREIARVRNEGNVEIAKLKQSLMGRPHTDFDLTAKENLSVKTRKQGGQIPLSNEVERQRRNLIQENETVKSRLRACEQLLNSGTQERVKFMEGASWLAKKASSESEHHREQMLNLVNEFVQRTRTSVKNECLNEYDGNKVAANKEWLTKELSIQVNDLNSRFQHMFFNVDHQLADACKKHKR